ncbi:hypothetical protein BDV12DRAFT_206525 [Aspergillus spectabilis]
MPNRRIEAAEQKLLPAIIDELAQKELDSLWAEYPSSPTTFNEGFKQITYAQFANAVNACAHFIALALGRSNTGEPLAWLAPNDPRCSITIIAAMKAGFKLFLISERNSVATNHKLFNDVGCSTVLTTSLLFPPVQAIRSERELDVVELPPLEKLLNETQPEYPFQMDMSTSYQEVALIVHTSGSTGFPKPMYIKNEFLSKSIRGLGIPAPEGYITQISLISNKRCVLLLPLGHPAGVTFGLLFAFFANITLILPLPSIPPTAEALVNILAQIPADWAALAPLTLETISKDMSSLDIVGRKLETLVFSGATKVRLLSSLGSSETGPLPAIYRKGYDFKEDWNYLQFPPELGASFDPRPGGVYELVFNRTTEADPYQAVFASYPDSSVFRTKDLFAEHPTIPDIWTHASRSDDVIVFLNGEKVNPVDYESHISRHPDVAAALMFGHQRFEAGLLIELSDQRPLSASGRARVIQKIWPSIEEANQILPGYAQVSETHLCFTEPGKSVLRTLKSTIRRQATLDANKDRINQVYADSEKMWASSSARPDLGSVVAVQRIAHEALETTTQIKGIGLTEDFFQRGMDSLQVLRLFRHLRQTTALGSITPSMIYLNPSISALAERLYQLAHDEELSEQKMRHNKLNTRAQILQKYLVEIDALFPGSVNNTTYRSETQKNKVIILTGSTGTIGSYILNTLMNRPDVAHIYCLNRSQDSADLQRSRNAQQDPTLPQTFPESKVTFLTADLTKPTLNLPTNIYKTLQSETTHLIHNAWPVDFNLPLQTFTPHLQGTVNLASFCANSIHKADPIFISSISAVMNFPTLNPNTPIPESINPNVKTPADAGYAESKYIAERLLLHASQTLGIKATILRLGQISGPARSPGQWNPNDWIPALVRGSRELGVIPDSLSLGPNTGNGNEAGDIDWLPIDIAAEVIVEIGINTTPNGGPGTTRVFHPLNPHRTTWKSLLPTIITVLETHEPRKSIEVVSPGAWLARLRAAAASGQSLADSEGQEQVHANPALKLIDFFSDRFGGSNLGEMGWETEGAKGVSERLRSAERVERGMMGGWVRGWLDN